MQVRVRCAGECAVCCAYLPYAVILINEISAGVPMNAPDVPATIPTHRQTDGSVAKCMCVRTCACTYRCSA